MIYSKWKMIAKSLFIKLDKNAPHGIGVAH